VTVAATVALAVMVVMLVAAVAERGVTLALVALAV
jgi:hypothetical protein